MRTQFMFETHEYYGMQVWSYPGRVVGRHQVKWSLMCRVARECRVAAILDEKQGRKRVPSQDGQVQQTVALGVHAVQVTLVAHQRGGDTLVAVQESQVEGDVPLVVTFVESVGKLWDVRQYEPFTHK